MTERPFRVLGLQQIAIGGLDKGALTGLWTGLLGVEKVGDYVSESENVDEDILRLGDGPHAVEIDLMQPLDPERSPEGARADAQPRRCVDRRPRGLRRLADASRACGSRRVGSARVRRATTCASSIRRATTTRPAAAKGVLIELVQAPPDVIAALG